MAATELAARPASTLRRDRGVASVRDIPSNQRSDQPTPLLIGRTEGDGLNSDVTQSVTTRQEALKKSALSGKRESGESQEPPPCLPPRIYAGPILRIRSFPESAM